MPNANTLRDYLVARLHVRRFNDAIYNTDRAILSLADEDIFPETDSGTTPSVIMTTKTVDDLVARVIENHTGFPNRLAPDTEMSFVYFAMSNSEEEGNVTQLADAELAAVTALVDRVLDCALASMPLADNYA